MRNFSLSKAVIVFGVVIAAFSSCKDDSYLAVVPPDTTNYSFVEEFDTITSAYARDWRFINSSNPRGDGTWQQAVNTDYIDAFPAYSSHSTADGFISADFSSTSADQGAISNWAISPITKMKNGDKIIFYTRTQIYDLGAGDSTDYANRLQVRINKDNPGMNVGIGTDPGDFKIVLLDINPFYKEYHVTPSLSDAGAYPARWTRFEATVTGLTVPIKTRFAFRYYVEDGGFNGRGFWRGNRQCGFCYKIKFVKTYLTNQGYAIFRFIYIPGFFHTAAARVIFLWKRL